MKRRMLPLLLLAFGCSTPNQMTRLAGDNTRLERGAAVVIATPADGAYGEKQYTGSGLKTATALQAAFANYTPKTSVVSDCAELDCLKARAADARYLIVPRIVHWEDRATQWSGKPDRVNVQVSVYERGGDREINAAMLSTETGGVFAFTDEAPETLLEGAIKPYVQSLYEGS